MNKDTDMTKNNAPQSFHAAFATSAGGAISVFSPRVGDESGTEAETQADQTGAGVDAMKARGARK
ncbi:hypothetical protein [Salipiger profundus]|jgi:hypothetical protein|nr:hypothetical protein [Salipiger profundus]